MRQVIIFEPTPPPPKMELLIPLYRLQCDYICKSIWHTVDPQLFFIFLTQFLAVSTFSPSVSLFFFFQYLLTPVSTLNHTVNIKHYFNYLIKEKLCPGAPIFPLYRLALRVFVIPSWPCLHLIYFLSAERYHKTRIVLTSCLL